MSAILIFQQSVNSESFFSSPIVNVLSALLTPVIAIIALYIAIQQHLINKRRLKFEMYERKLKVFKVVNEYLLEIQTDAKTTFPRCSEFYSDASEAAFLFSKSIQKVIDEIRVKSIEMIDLGYQLYPRDGSEGLPVGEEREKISKEETKLLKWHLDKLRDIKELFKKEMEIK